MRQQNVAAAATKSVATMPPKRKTLNKNDLKGEILSRVRGGVNPPLREGLRIIFIILLSLLLKPPVAQRAGGIIEILGVDLDG